MQQTYTASIETDDWYIEIDLLVDLFLDDEPGHQPILVADGYEVEKIFVSWHTWVGELDGWPKYHEVEYLRSGCRGGCHYCSDTAQPLEVLLHWDKALGNAVSKAIDQACNDAADLYMEENQR